MSKKRVERTNGNEIEKPVSWENKNDKIGK
jgi:hypothetical protein